MPKKPDRFDRIANKVTNRYIGTYVGGPEHAMEIAKLIRNEHDWMLGMVQKLKTNVDARTKMGVGHNVACDYILAELDKRRK